MENYTPQDYAEYEDEESRELREMIERLESSIKQRRALAKQMEDESNQLNTSSTNSINNSPVITKQVTTNKPVSTTTNQPTTNQMITSTNRVTSFNSSLPKSAKESIMRRRPTPKLEKNVDINEDVWADLPRERTHSEKVMRILGGFPEPMQEIARHIQSVVNCPMDYVVFGMLQVISAAIGSEARLTNRQYENYCNISTLFIGHSAAGKTPVMKTLLRPLQLLDDYNRGNFQQEMRQYKRMLAENKDAYIDEENRPKQKRIIFSDQSEESRNQKIAENPKGVLLRAAEAGGLLQNLNRYSKNSDNGVSRLINLLDGDDVYIDRKSDPEPIFIKQPFVGLSLDCQPSVVKKLLGGEDIMNMGFNHRLCFVYPENADAVALSEVDYDDLILAQWRTYIEELYFNDFDYCEPPVPDGHYENRKNKRRIYPHYDKDNLGNATLLTVSENAREVFRCMHNANVECINDCSDNYIISLLSKMDIFALKYALIHHVMHCLCDGECRGEVDSDSMEWACDEVCEYLESTARKVYSIIAPVEDIEIPVECTAEEMAEAVAMELVERYNIQDVDKFLSSQCIEPYFVSENTDRTHRAFASFTDSTVVKYFIETYPNQVKCRSLAAYTSISYRTLYNWRRDILEKNSKRAKKE